MSPSVSEGTPVAPASPPGCCVPVAGALGVSSNVGCPRCTRLPWGTAEGDHTAASNSVGTKSGTSYSVSHRRRIEALGASAASWWMTFATVACCTERLTRGKLLRQKVTHASTAPADPAATLRRATASDTAAASDDTASTGGWGANSSSSFDFSWRGAANNTTEAAAPAPAPPGPSPFTPPVGCCERPHDDQRR